MTSLGTLGGNLSSGAAINALGQVTGYAALNANAAYHAFITGSDGLGMTDLGTLAGALHSFGHGINGNGQVVGRASSADYAFDRAFITGANGADMIDLNTLVDLTDGAILYDAIAINDAGWVLALGKNMHSYLLAPATAVPEPATFVLLLVGLCCVALARRHCMQ
jgi:probable HAF family extracellular repeat protein